MYVKFGLCCSVTDRDAAEQHVNAGPSTPRQRQAVGSQGPRSFQQLYITPQPDTRDQDIININLLKLDGLGKLS